MSYIEQSDIEAAFGADNVRIWSNLDGSENAVDATRIAKAIAIAEDHINSRFRGSKYVIPFNIISDTIKNWCARLAGMWLFESRPAAGGEKKDENFLDVREAVDSEISQCLAGIINLDAELVVTKGGPAVVG